MTHLTAELERIVATALAEDLGSGDITSQLTIPASLKAQMRFVARQDLVACGTFIPGMVYAQINTYVRTQILVREGQRLRAGDVMATATGSARALLAGERVALNLMQRASGVATLTAQYVKAVKGTRANILDTRKTMPGLRALDKYAVRCGGGTNHRMRLDDMVLIKDNHLAGCGDGVVGCGQLIKQVRQKLSMLPAPRAPLPLVIECDTLAQVKEALAAKPDRILLDNMSLKNLRAAVKLCAGKVKLESSGGISLKSVRQVAKTGVNYISVGRLTHSAPAADIAAEIKTRS